ncbi:hypothetical protein ACWDGI_05540 [Streptomyces sp. NPDC001220]
MVIGSRSRRGLLSASETASSSESARSNPGPGSSTVSGTGTTEPHRVPVGPPAERALRARKEAPEDRPFLPAEIDW